ncbi:hypothetical protein [Chitinilyticum piscinae]|uniref:Uncharacterized protein n=1 Tax=Chitinilyticum piscinae TaxID=2866724 RepID=A0A8J7FJK9_9NEIS|nr:hypothetical protein [Chitinilyticum piscinae]MBE9608742.1 hypothetical protein [Chitinilyticum piscinae]
MRYLTLVTVILGALLLGQVAIASQEGVLAFGEFQFSSPGIGESGPVVVSGAQSGSQITALAVQAFGKTIRLSKFELSKLKVGFINGIQVSYEAGYKDLGGRTVYLVLSKGFTSGTKNSQHISINEHGKVEIASPNEK